MPTLKKKVTKKVVETDKPKPVYDKVETKLFLRNSDLGPLTVEMLKDMIGWEELSAENNNLEKVYLFEDQCSPPNKVRLNRNARNRSFDYNRAMSYAQDKLNGNWSDSEMGTGPDDEPYTINGESIVIGRYGNVLSGQHRICGWIFADQIRQRDKNKWEGKWPEPLTFEALVVTGISEDTKIVSTIDNVLTRSFADVLSTDPTMFADFIGANGERIRIGAIDRKKMCKQTEAAVNFLWNHRLCMNNPQKNAFAASHGHRTNSEAREFLDRHPKLKECVRHIWQENGGNNIGAFMNIGYAAALLYLMGSSSSDADSYYSMEVPSEKKLKWDRWDKAKKFWTELSKASLAPPQGDLKVLVTAQRPGSRTELDGLYFSRGEGGGSFQERCAVLCKAWKAYLENDKVVKWDLKLKYKKVDKDDPLAGMVLVEKTSMGGIDMGDQGIQDETDESEELETKREMLKEKLLKKRAQLPGTPEPVGPIDRVKAEVPPPEPVKYDKDGKPPTLKIKTKPLTSK